MRLDAVLLPKIAGDVGNDFLPGERKRVNNATRFCFPPDKLPAHVPTVMPAKGSTPYY